MEDYKSNSFKSKEKEPIRPDKKIEPIVTKSVKVKKKTGFDKLAGVFISEDVDNVKSYVIKDVIIPAIKNVIEDVVVNGIRIVLRGDSGSSKNTNSSKVSYRQYYEKNNRRDYSYKEASRGYDYDEIIIDNRGEAENVLDTLFDMLNRYNVVSVADFYDLVGVTGKYTDYKYGWLDLNNSKIVRVREGYIIKLPKAVPLD